MDNLPKIIAAALAMTTIAELKTPGEPHAPQEGKVLDPLIGKMAMEALVSGEDIRIRPDEPGIYKMFPRKDRPKK
jgi:hypothetical protein